MPAPSAMLGRRLRPRPPFALIEDEEERMDAKAGAYVGKILHGDYSPALKQRLRQAIAALGPLTELAPRVFPYIAAWRTDDPTIWYEFVGQRLATLFRCQPAELAATFKRCLIDRRSYKYIAVEAAVREEIITRQQLGGYWSGLRKEAASGMVEAVYKVATPEERIVWLKDWAVSEHFARDGIYLSCGTLTDVTKEMDHKELLEQIGYFDELTKLPKRGIMHRLLDVNIGQVERGHLSDFVFLMLDVDHFKTINDTHGHQAGDHVLAALAEALASMKRKEDEIGRYAGEEFYGISHGSLESGRRFAERLRRSVEESDFRWQGERIPVTVSIGVAAASELEELVPEKLVNVADRRLYAAKRRGRNQVVWQDA